MQELPVYKHWRGAVNLHAQNIPSIESILSAIDEFPIVHKDGVRSFVCQGSLFGMEVVAKQARDKHRRPFARVLSIVRAGEARRTFISLLKFKELGIESVNPIGFLEKRRFGMVVDSWLLYEFRKGEVCSKDDFPEIVLALNKLHQGGFRHLDLVFNNFLIDENGQLFLIDCSGRPRLGYYSDFYDFMSLAEISEKKGVSKQVIEQLMPINQQGFQRRLGFCLARLYFAYKRARSKFKTSRRSKRERNRNARSYRRGGYCFLFAQVDLDWGLMQSFMVMC